MSTTSKIADKVANALAEDLRAGTGMTHFQARVEVTIPEPTKVLMVGNVTWVELDVDYTLRWYTTDLPQKCAPSEYTHSVDSLQEAIEDSEEFD